MDVDTIERAHKKYKGLREWKTDRRNKQYYYDLANRIITREL
jgi:hypothetical protein